MYKLVLLRHGESLWNKDNRFTGWTDIGLTEKGIAEAKNAGKLLKEGGYELDVAYTSVLKRAIKSLWLALEEMDLMWIPIIHSWRLNERHYGALQGFNKSEKTQEVGEEQVFKWRRSYDIRPPELEKTDDRYPGNEAKYASMDEKDIPLTECLKDTVARFIPYWEDEISPMVKSGKNVIIAAHGNSLRALIKYLDNVSEEDIPGLNIPTGVPLVYELDDDLKPIKHYYLGDPEEIKKATDKVAHQADKEGEK